MHDDARDPHPASNGDRLDSWKEIAAYLKQGVRTVQRWEREEGLPVHRPPGKKRGTVYAFQSQLDAWFQERAGEGPQASAHNLRAKPLLAVAALLALAAAIWLLREPREETTAATRTEQALTTVAPGTGRISPDGTTLAYRPQGDDSLHLRDMLSGESDVIVDTRVEPQMAWSWDSQTIAYTAKRGDEHRLETFDLSTRESTVLRSGESYDDARLPIGWAPGGRLLCSTSGYDSVELISVVDGKVQREQTLEADIRDPALSPDGRALAYAKRNGRFYDLKVKLLDSDGDAMPVSKFDESERFPFWSPDGTKLLFVRMYGISTSEKSEIWGVSFDPERGSVSSEPYFAGSATGLFREIPAVIGPEGSLYWANRERGMQAQILELDSGNGAPMGLRTDFPKGSTAKQWAPDAPARLYFWDPSVRWQVLSDVLAFRERDLVTGDERLHQIPWPDLEYGGFSYSTDHTEAVFEVREEEGYALYHFLVETEATEKVTASTESLWGTLANDKSRIGFVRGRHDHDAAIGVVDLKTGGVRILHEGSFLSTPAWSPDDTEIAFTEGPCLFVVGVDHGKVARLACAPEIADASRSLVQRRRVMGNPTWSPDGRMLAWATLDPSQERAEIWVVDRASGETRVVWQGEESYRSSAMGPSWSPNGEFISFTLLTQPPVQIWAIRDPSLLGDVA